MFNTLKKQAEDVNSSINNKIYIPNFEQAPYIPLNIQLLFKIETKLKLNLISEDDQSMYPESQKQEIEVHYMQIETITEKTNLKAPDISLKGIKDKMYTFLFESRDISEKEQEWIITDFDYCLEGNPYTKYD